MLTFDGLVKGSQGGLALPCLFSPLLLGSVEESWRSMYRQVAQVDPPELHCEVVCLFPLLAGHPPHGGAAVRVRRRLGRKGAC